jgi:hypothetical protein
MINAPCFFLCKVNDSARYFFDRFINIDPQKHPHNSVARYRGKQPADFGLE